MTGSHSTAVSGRSGLSAVSVCPGLSRSPAGARAHPWLRSVPRRVMRPVTSAAATTGHQWDHLELGTARGRHRPPQSRLCHPAPCSRLCHPVPCLLALSLRPLSHGPVIPSPASRPVLPSPSSRPCRHPTQASRSCHPDSLAKYRKTKYRKTNIESQNIDVA